MKKWKILEVIEPYANHENVTEVEEHVDLLYLKRLTERFFIINALLVSIVLVVLFFIIRISYMNKDVIVRAITFKEGQIKSEVKLLRDARESLTVSAEEFQSIKQDQLRTRLASAIVEHYYSKGSPTSFKSVKRLICAIEECVPKYLKGTPFTVEDMMSLVSIESCWDTNEIGKHGERGAFQILDYKSALKEIGKPWSNPLDPYVNTEMGCHVLKQKYSKYKDYKKAIIAYNGYILGDNGEPIETYWEIFKSIRPTIKHLKKTAKEETNGW